MHSDFLINHGAISVFGCHHQEEIILKDHYIRPEGDNFYKILLAKGEFNGF